MWEALRDIAVRQQRSIHALVTDIDAEREEQSLTNAIRVYLVRFYRTEAIRVSGRAMPVGFIP
jgi:predicted DNA-binding ribbon-helix-helix protein